MNFLFYLEPHPIRNSYINFVGTIRYFLPVFKNISSDDKIFIYSNKTALDNIRQKYKIDSSALIYPTAEEEQFFESFMTDWETTGIRDWMTLMAKPNARYVQIIKRVCRDNNIHYLLHWATNASVKQALKGTKVGLIDMELGCCRAPYLSTLAADPWGVNGGAVLSKASDKDLNVVDEVNPAVLDLMEFSKHADDEAYLKGFEYFTNKKLLSFLDKGNKVAFIPLQLFDDANLLMYSPFKSPLEALKAVLPILNQYHYSCIIKEHPLSERRGGLSLKANAEAKKYAKTFKNILWIDKSFMDLNNALIYKLADLVITINSSTGFEALFYDKPVVVLGEAVYKVSGVFPTLKQFVSDQFNKKDYLLKIAKIRSFFLKSYLIDEQTFDYDSFKKRMVLLGNLSRQRLSTKKIIEILWKNKN